MISVWDCLVIVIAAVCYLVLTMTDPLLSRHTVPVRNCLVAAMKQRIKRTANSALEDREDLSGVKVTARLETRLKRMKQRLSKAAVAGDDGAPARIGKRIEEVASTIRDASGACKEVHQREAGILLESAHNALTDLASTGDSEASSEDAASGASGASVIHKAIEGVKRMASVEVPVPAIVRDAFGQSRAPEPETGDAMILSEIEHYKTS
jgi:hypothetical protein